MEAPTLSETFKLPPDLPQECWDPRMIIALFEIGSISLLFWSSLFSLKKNNSQASEQLTTQRLEDVLSNIEGILRNVTGLEKTTGTNESLEATQASDDDMLNLEEKLRGLDKINKMLFKSLLATLDPEKCQSPKNQENIPENQDSTDVVPVFTVELVDHAEEEKDLDGTKGSEKKTKCGLPQNQEKNLKLRDSMDQLLQKAECWSEQHSELSGLLKSYQKSQHDIRELFKNTEVHFETPSNNKVSTTQEMEEQVRELEHETHSLHLTAALLENECQILQHRVGLLNKLHLNKERAQTEEEKDQEEQKPAEAEQVIALKQKPKDREVTHQKSNNFSTWLDVGHNKKARNNRLNIHIAKRGLLGRKRSANRLR
ncbi:spermatogenic leucine zipper protein 1 [Echinops telfairi]|uniref:Spermatogenic leucine zipper protein 1 n=1 Tax=Echinops telfairi TaxID=9371 RepID=A0ABM0IMW2_ECHTE|nr:spermatogenic leucine zipper protein 1 [Echinops telfairi]